MRISPGSKRSLQCRGVTLSGTSTGRGQVKSKVDAKPQAILRDAVCQGRSASYRGQPTESTRPRTVASAVPLMRICVCIRTRRQHSTNLNHPSQAVTGRYTLNVLPEPGSPKTHIEPRLCFTIL